MSGYKGGRKAYIRRDIENYTEAWVFDTTTDEYLGKGEFRGMTAEALAESPKSKAQVTALIKGQKQELKIMGSYIPLERPAASDILRNMALGIAASANPIDAEEAKSNIIHKTQMDEVIAIENEMKKTGTYDVSSIIPNNEGSGKKKIYLFPSDKKRDGK